MVASIGIDFGTTNTVLALAAADGTVATASFRADGDSTKGCRTVLTFTQGEDVGAPPIEVEIGPWAIRRYLAGPAECRFIQSPKSYLGSRLFQETRIYGRSYRLEDIVAVFLAELIDRSGEIDGALSADCVAGRPVTFWGSDPDDALAMGRLTAAYGDARLGRPDFVYEPVAASYYFATRLRQDATVLVADLGGGTTDYSVIRYEIGDGPPRVTPLAHRGVGIGGDRFDFASCRTRSPRWSAKAPATARSASGSTSRLPISTGSPTGMSFRSCARPRCCETCVTWRAWRTSRSGSIGFSNSSTAISASI
jgi:hypothetical chaperone protein